MAAHRQAAEKAKLLHRDISAGNLLIYEFMGLGGQVERRGILNDWELSKPLDTKEQRQPERTVSNNSVSNFCFINSHSVLGHVAIHVCASLVGRVYWHPR